MQNESFQTSEYSAVWLTFEGDREALRAHIQTFLRSELEDSGGKLVVNEQGPFWMGQKNLKGLSYSHTVRDDGTGIALLAFSTTHELGVDVEWVERDPKPSPMQIAERFFSPGEAADLWAIPPQWQREYFLEIWLKKEAYAKATRLGLAKTVQVDLRENTQFLFKSVDHTPVGYRALIALQTKI